MSSAKHLHDRTKSLLARAEAREERQQSAIDEVQDMHNNTAARNTELGRTIFNLTNRVRALEAEKLQLAYDCGTERQEHERQRRREAERTAGIVN